MRFSGRDQSGEAAAVIYAVYPSSISSSRVLDSCGRQDTGAPKQPSPAGLSRREAGTPHLAAANSEVAFAPRPGRRRAGGAKVEEVAAR
jgi:hypothetical protein